MHHLQQTQQLKTAHGGTRVYPNGRVASGTSQLVARSLHVDPGEPLKDTATPLRSFFGEDQSLEDP